ncbi:hypothetical protein, partial [Kitasatospora sp. MBT66]|uniref:hypothetical protein n=1 Tax=Kitasatospora sp. MBT66 TaxID=1444769 RepID=UPI001314C2BE
WPRRNRTVCVVWLPVAQEERGWANTPADQPEWTSDSRAYGKGVLDASRRTGWRLSRAGFDAHTEAVGDPADDEAWFAYDTGGTDWWISYEGR